MNNLPNINLDLSFPEKGVAWKVDLDFTRLLPALKEKFGVSLKNVIIPILTKLVRMQIRVLEIDQELKCLTQEGELELKHFQEQEKNLALWLNETNYE